VSRPRFLLEELEDRITPTTWLDPQHLTLSFVPDGTLASSAPSDLAQTLGTEVPTGDWRLELLRAFQTWAVNANVNIGLVPDGGQPLGTPGLVQGDPRFGDIRLAGQPLGNNLVASGTPFQTNGSTWSGDVLLNTQFPFGTGAPGKYDLFTVALHEAGHVFGLTDVTDPSSVMYGSYLGVRAGLSALDLTAFQAIYGTRQPDSFDALKPNDSPKTASPLGAFSSPVTADITTLDDVDYYKFSIPTSITAGTTVYAQVHTSGLSLLVPSLTVYDHSLQAVGSAAATSPLAGDLSVAIPNATPGNVYYVRVSNATRSVFGLGSYQLSLSTQGSLGAANSASPPANTENRPNDKVQTATWLTAHNSTPTSLDFSYQASITTPTDVDFYRVHSPATTNGATEEMIALVQASDLGGLAPRVDVYDASGAPVAAQVIGNEQGFFSVRLANALPDTTYYVEVSALAPSGSHNVGNYLVGIDFNLQPTVSLTSFAAGTVTATAPAQTQTLTVSQSSAYHFILAADAGGAPDVEVQMSIYDQAGNLVFQLVAFAGQPASTGLAYLAAGTYTVQYTAVSQSGVLPPSLSYSLQGSVVSDPIGPLLVDNTTTPTTTPTTTTADTGSIIDSWSGLSYLALALSPPYLNPHSY
jgi:hypothetical protein